MPTKLKYGTYLGLLVHPSVYDRIASAAEVQGVTKSDVVRAALDFFPLTRPEDDPGARTEP
jgi:hypothetical protein